MVKRAVVLAIVGSISTLMEAQPFERRLIPLAAIGSQGAFGTVWSTYVISVGELAETEVIGFVVTSVPPVVGRSQPVSEVVPRSVDEPPGTIVYVPRAAAHAVHLTAVVRERSGSGEEVVLPVVREDAFATRTAYFMGLTQTSSTRLTLRVYSLDLDAARAEVRVRIQANVPPYLRPWEFVYDRVHVLSARQRLMSDWQGTVSVPIRPLALELGLDSLLPTIPEGAELAVSVVPAGELRIWSMLSETNVTTQRVKLLLPD